MKQRKLSRRKFLSATVAIPTVISASAIGADKKVAPSNRISMGFIGTGGRMRGLMGSFLTQKDMQAVAVADPRDQARAQGLKQAKIDAKGSYRDFRELLARKDIDAVAIASPDHWHVLQAKAAVEAGKDVYCEKPLSNTIAESQALLKTVKRYGAVFQHGTQLHSMAPVRQACQLVRNKKFGEVKKIVIGSPPGKISKKLPAEPVPDNIDYEMWQGPAPRRDYNSVVVNKKGWYFISDYSQSGWIAGYGVHDIDIAQWAIGMERSGPVEIEGKGVFPKQGTYNTVTTYEIRFKYSNGVELLMTDTGRNKHGVTFHGEKGWVFTRSRIDANPKSLIKETFGPNDVHLYKSPGHSRNFLDCIKTRTETITPIEIAHRATSTALLGGIAVKLGRKLKWDPEKEQFQDDDEATRLLSCPMHPPWRI